MSILQFRFKSYLFKPSLLGIMVTICCVPLFIKLGYWQYNKAEHKQALRAMYEAYEKSPPSQLPDQITQPEQWRYKPVQVSGLYLPQYQILLDNQIEGGRVGYHVITPLLIENSHADEAVNESATNQNAANQNTDSNRGLTTHKVVLVNRGWIPAPDRHTEVPVVTTPSGRQVLSGKVWVPGTKFYSLEAKPLTSDPPGKQVWEPVWQNMDMAAYKAAVPYDTLPVAIRLDSGSSGGGFIRNWIMPDDRVATNIGYAYQWFGFAVAAVIIFIVVSVKKTALPIANP